MPVDNSLIKEEASEASWMSAAVQLKDSSPGGTDGEGKGNTPRLVGRTHRDNVCNKKKIEMINGNSLVLQLSKQPQRPNESELEVKKGVQFSRATEINGATNKTRHRPMER